jgi:NTP pyrophosphatase (non-canonical NTP hydrolase)
MISDETVKIVTDFRDEREWSQFHNPKDLALSITLEAAELLEIFQWSGDDLVCADKLDKIKEELADVLCYSILMADRCGLNMDEIIRDKMKKNGEKYPASAARGHKEKYTELKALARKDD